MDVDEFAATPISEAAIADFYRQRPLTMLAALLVLFTGCAPEAAECADAFVKVVASDLVPPEVSDGVAHIPVRVAGIECGGLTLVGSVQVSEVGSVRLEDPVDLGDGLYEFAVPVVGEIEWCVAVPMTVLLLDEQGAEADIDAWFLPFLPDVE